MTGAEPPRMTRANPAGSCRIMSGVATSWREAWSCPRTFHDACPHNVLAAWSVVTSVMPGRNTFTELVSRTTWRPCSPHRSASWASPCTTATTWMPLPPESDSQDGSGTGQICVTSSRPISSGGSSRLEKEDWPVCAAIQWVSEEHTSELQSRLHLVCRLLLEKKKKQ